MRKRDESVLLWQIERVCEGEGVYFYGGERKREKEGVRKREEERKKERETCSMCQLL